MKKFLPKFVTPEGFTLVELLVVISIIAVLSVIGITIFTGVQKNARDAKRKSDIQTISKALETNLVGSSTSPYQSVASGWFAEGRIPMDPISTQSYTTPTLPSTIYYVCAKLENKGGNYSDSSASTTATNGDYYCLKNQQ